MAKIKDDGEGSNLPLMSASQYTASRKAAVTAAKSQKIPLGMAPELPKDKMRQLNQGLAQARQAMTPQFPGLPPVDSENSSDHSINRAAMSSSNPMTLGEAKKKAMQSKQQEVEEPTAKYRPLSPEAKEALEGGTVEEEQQEEEEDSDLFDDDQAAAEEKLAGGLPKMPALPYEPTEANPIRTQLLSKKRKEFIENKLAPISFGDLVMKGEIVQRIEIRKDFYIQLRTLKEYENLYVVRKLYGVVGSNAYVEELMGMYRVACSLVSINGQMLPDHRKNVGDVVKEDIDDRLFDHKVEIIKRLALPVLIEVGIQYDWLMERVNKLLTLDSLKNG